MSDHEFRRTWLVGIGACAWLALAGCGGPDEPHSESSAASPRADREKAPPDGLAPYGVGETTPVAGDWLVVHLLADPESLNPVTSNDAAASAVLNWIFPSLLRLDNETLEQKPLIASALPEVSDDKLTYTFHLRQDVTFSDGRPLTAADVVFTLKVIKDPKVLAPHARNYFLAVRDAVALDDYTVRVDMREQYFLNYLVLGSLSPLPRHYYDPNKRLETISVEDMDRLGELGAASQKRVEQFSAAFNRDFHRNPMGPGAFEIRDPATDIVTGERVVLHHRRSFWAPGDTTHGDAWVDRVVFRIINDREAALVALKGGDLDVMGLSPLQERRRDTNSERFASRLIKKTHVSPGYTYIGWNERKPIFQDRQVRQALGYFVDKQSMIDKILFGLGVPVESPIFIGRPEYDHDLPAHVFDPAKGQALLARAGWHDSDHDGILDKRIAGQRVPLRFEIISNSGNDTRKAVGLTLIDEMKRAGIDASFRELDWSIMLEKVKSFDYDAVILGWAMSVTPPDAFQVWHSSQAVAGGSNHVSYRNPQVDRILETYRREFDPEKRKKLYQRFQEIIAEDQPYTFLFMQKAVTAYDRRFHGVTWYPSGGTDMAEWWVPRGQQRYRP